FFNLTRVSYCHGEIAMDSITRVNCPSCGQAVINPAVSAENTIRCAACAHVFTLPVAEPEATQATAGELAAPPVVILPPLGNEPPPTSYGLLHTVAWTLLIAFVASGAWGLYVQFSGPRMMRVGRGTLPV